MIFDFGLGGLVLNFFGSLMLVIDIWLDLHGYFKEMRSPIKETKDGKLKWLKYEFGKDGKVQQMIRTTKEGRLLRWLFFISTGFLFQLIDHLITSY